MSTARQFDKLGIEYTKVDLNENPEKLAEFKALGYTAAPIVTTDVKIWSGFRLEKIKSLANHIKSLERHG
jgi:glutaredoxin-like protein NrdH